MKELPYIPINEYYCPEEKYKMDIRLLTEPLSAKSQRKAELELRETPERIKESVAELRSLIKSDENLYFDTSEEFLMMYLRPTKYYAESAYQLMKRGAEFQKNYPQLVKDILPIHKKDVMMNTNVLNVLQNRDQEGRRVLLFNCGGSWNPDVCSTETLFHMLYFIQLAATLEPETQVNGGVIILNFTGMGLKQAKQLTPMFSFKLLTFIQEVMPVRLKEIHIVFQPYVFKIVWQIFKPLIKEKLRKRLFFHGSNLESLHKYIDPDCLPLDYGGTMPKLNYTSAQWYPVLESIEDKIKERNMYGYAKN